jgi:hypothetical protein
MFFCISKNVVSIKRFIDFVTSSTDTCIRLLPIGVITVAANVLIIHVRAAR